MREQTNWTRTKKTYKIDINEFLEGKWLKEIKPSEFLEITYLARPGVLIIKDCNVKDEGSVTQNGD